jgi:FMN-dependent NADH-azoreductase
LRPLPLGFRAPAAADMSDVQKREISVSTRSGVYSTNDWGRAAEHQESYLQTVFGFLGITDVRFVRAEGVAMGDAKKAEALGEAANSIVKLAA